MKKATKAIVFGTFLAAGLSGLMYMNIGAPPGHRRHGHRHGRGHGRRRHWRGHGWGSGVNLWVGGGPRRTRYVPVPVERPIERYNWRDSAGSMSWEIINRMPNPIIVTSDSTSREIRAGGSVLLSRNSGFGITVQAGKNVRSFETSNHYVEIYPGRRWTSPWRTGSIKWNSYVEWPGRR